ncbi:uncharacterized protein LOC129742679 [Uranotaenia lowii]|uniref:uncharacterized protein LOC129742679 n=1 Tax=Uranotaenia lowii TaxID=190385 RepID=UPI002478361E|nr:uncharacterized protein LOC129742679 [Uranotaenia lowii]
MIGELNVDNHHLAELESAVTTLPSLVPPPATSASSSMQNRSIVNSQLTVYYQNAGGMRTKTNQFLLALSSCEYDIVMITETWLKDDIANSELALNYSIYRNDRNSNTSQLNRGGGVLIAVRHGIEAVSIAVPGCDHLEQIVVRIKDQCRFVYLCCVYFRPNSETAQYSSHMSAIDQLTNTATCRDVIVVAGDYNLPNLNWSFNEDTDSFLPVNASTEQELAVIECTIASGLSQMCSLVNVNGRILDLIFLNRPDLAEVVNPPHAILNTDRHHHSSILLIDNTYEEIIDTVRPDTCSLDFRLCDTDRVIDSLAEKNWHSAFANLDIDSALSTFYDQLWGILRENTPPRRPNRHKPFKLPWWNSELRRSRNSVHKARKRYFKEKSDQNKSILSRLEVEYSALRNTAFKRYISNIERNVKQDPSSFWKFMNSRRLKKLKRL